MKQWQLRNDHDQGRPSKPASRQAMASSSRLRRCALAAATRRSYSASGIFLIVIVFAKAARRLLDWYPIWDIMASLDLLELTC